MGSTKPRKRPTFRGSVGWQPDRYGIANSFNVGTPRNMPPRDAYIDIVSCPVGYKLIKAWAMVHGDDD